MHLQLVNSSCSRGGGGIFPFSFPERRRRAQLWGKPLMSTTHSAVICYHHSNRIGKGSPPPPLTLRMAIGKHQPSGALALVTDQEDDDEEEEADHDADQAAPPPPAPPHHQHLLYRSSRANLSYKSSRQFTGHDADAPSAEVWRRKRTAWLCKELPVRAGGKAFFRMLKDQRKWMRLADTHKVMEQLMRRGELACAYHVLKWALEQPWYACDYGITTRLGNAIARARDDDPGGCRVPGKARKAHELLDLVAASGRPPDASTYAAVILAYLQQGSSPQAAPEEQQAATASAWGVYHRMVLAGGYDPPVAAQTRLFAALARAADGGGPDAEACGMRAALVFRHVQAASPRHCTPDMHRALMRVHARAGDRAQMDALLRRMRVRGVALGRDGYTALLHLCWTTRDPAALERTWLDMVKAGHRPDARGYLYALKTFRAAGMPHRVRRRFLEMLELAEAPPAAEHTTTTGTTNITGQQQQAATSCYKAYLVAIQSMAEACLETHALDFLARLRATGMAPLLPAYNAVLAMHLRTASWTRVPPLFFAMPCRPNRDSYRMLIEAHVRAGHLDRADAVWDHMVGVRGYTPDQRTRRIMVAAHRARGDLDRVKAVVAAVADRRAPGVGVALGAEQRDAVVGLLVGGAGMSSDDDGVTYSLRVEVAHGEEEDDLAAATTSACLLDHLEYCVFSIWKEEQLLPPLPPPPPLAAAAGAAGGAPPTTTGRSFSTVSHAAFRFFAARYRPRGERVVPRLIRLWLTPRALAYWYMFTAAAAGAGGQKRCQPDLMRGGGGEGGGGMWFRAPGYSAEDVVLLVEALKGQGVYCHQRSCSCGSHDRSCCCWIEVTGEAAQQRAWELMEPHVLEDCKRFLTPPEAADST